MYIYILYNIVIYIHIDLVIDSYMGPQSRDQLPACIPMDLETQRQNLRMLMPRVLQTSALSMPGDPQQIRTMAEMELQHLCHPAE